MSAIWRIANRGGIKQRNTADSAVAVEIALAVRRLHYLTRTDRDGFIGRMLQLQAIKVSSETLGRAPGGIVLFKFAVVARQSIISTEPEFK